MGIELTTVVMICKYSLTIFLLWGTCLLNLTILLQGYNCMAPSEDWMFFVTNFLSAAG